MKAISSKLWIVSIGVRLLAAAVLLFGPWTDSPDELSGWDIERFHEIATTEGKPYVNFDVEYPPGSVVVIEGLATPGTTQPEIVPMHRRLILVALGADVLIAVFLKLIAGMRAAKAYVILGVPLVPMGLLRLDLVAALLATVAFWALIYWAKAGQANRSRSKSEQSNTEQSNTEQRFPTSGLVSVPLFAMAVAVGALVKIWPVLILGAALSLRQFRQVGAAVGALGLCGAAWLIWVGDGLSPVEQVLSLRGATGWHVESTPGSLVALLSSNEPRLELNAFRIGTSQGSVILAGRFLSIAAMIGLITLGFLKLTSKAQDHVETTRIAAVVMLGSVASLVVTAPLLSPQFILWLTPWAAILLSTAGDNEASKRLVIITFIISVLTGGTLLLFGPAGVASTVPAALIVLRNLLLVVVVGLCLQSLRSTEQQRPSSQTAHI